jgi:hypothetical protein
VGALCKPLGGFFETPALSFELQQVAAVHNAVEQRRYDDNITDDFMMPPFLIA